GRCSTPHSRPTAGSCGARGERRLDHPWQPTGPSRSTPRRRWQRVRPATPRGLRCGRISGCPCSSMRGRAGGSGVAPPPAPMSSAGLRTSPPAWSRRSRSAPSGRSRRCGAAWETRRSMRRRRAPGTTFSPRSSCLSGRRRPPSACRPRLGGFAPHVLAVRLAAGASGGPLGERFKAGGVSSGALGLTFGQALGATRDFPVRGYRAGELLGRRAATATVEYRLPLALVGAPFGHLPFGADKLWLNIFGDAGDAWDPGAAPRLTRLRSAGAELAGDLTLNYDFLVQLRLGVAAPLADPPSGAAR